MPKLLRLISLEITDAQSGDFSVGDQNLVVDNVRFWVVLDGQPVRWLGWNQMQGQIHRFSDSDNLTDKEHVGAEQPFVFWSLADLTVYEADRAGSNVGWDNDTDEWIQTVRLDHRDETTLEIGKESTLSYLMPGRSDCSYKLTYSVQDTPVRPDDDLFNRIAKARTASEFIGQGVAHGDLETDKGECRWICSIDGGGLRGIFPLRVLEQLEDYYQRPCFDIFDMFAGTSTGSMIASALASGRPLKEVIAVYTDEPSRTQIFKPNTAGQRHAFFYLDLKRLSAAGQAAPTLDNALSPAWIEDKIESFKGKVNRLFGAVAQQIMTPRYVKTGMKHVLYQLLSERAGNRLRPLELRELGKDGVAKDILVTARDLNRNETAIFSAFHIPHETTVPVVDPALGIAVARTVGPPQEGTHPTRVEDVVTGRYQDVLAKDAVEASSSAPVYFSPRARFTDGGVGPYNNPSFAAAFEALFRSNIDTSEEHRSLERKYTPYSVDGGKKSGTVVWSLGTAYPLSGTEAEAGAASVVGGSQSLNKRTDIVTYWADRIIDSLMFGASQEQVFLCREVLKEQIKYIRINLGLNHSSLHDLDYVKDRDEALESIGLDAYLPHAFHIMDEVAQRFALKVRDARFGFDTGGYEFPNPYLDDAALDTYVTYVKQEFEEWE